MSVPRLAAVAGRFYPDDPDELAAAVTDYVATARQADVADPFPKAIIAPHAGYPYSGPIAGAAYARLRAAERPPVKRVVLLGPAHWWPATGLALPGADAFQTPLGLVPVDAQAVTELAGLDFVHTAAEAHAREHALEVQLPFLQRVLSSPFALVPLLVGQASAAQLDAVFEMLWGGPETLIVVSSDLSHFHDYQTARRLDRTTSDAIEALDSEAIAETGACGRQPIQGLLRAARRHGLRVSTVDLRNSGDTAGSRAQVVGYGAYVLY